MHLLLCIWGDNLLFALGQFIETEKTRLSSFCSINQSINQSRVTLKTLLLLLNISRENFKTLKYSNFYA